MPVANLNNINMNKLDSFLEQINLTESLIDEWRESIDAYLLLFE